MGSLFKFLINSINEKLIFRHPHVFGEREVSGAKEVISNWEELKIKEGNGNKTVLGGVPNSLPALIKAHRIQDKARAVGFDWADRDDVWQKVDEEIAEVMDCPIGTVRSRIFRARDAIDKELKPLLSS